MFAPREFERYRIQPYWDYAHYYRNNCQASVRPNDDRLAKKGLKIDVSSFKTSFFALLHGQALRQ
jgi:hypothetical protein